MWRSPVSPSLLDQQQSLHGVARVDVAQPAAHREPQDAAHVLLDRPRRHAVHIARPDHEPRVGDHHVLTLVGGPQGVLLAPCLRPCVAEVAPAVVTVDQEVRLGAGMCRVARRPHGADAGHVDDAADARLPGRGEQRRRPVHVDRLQGRFVARPVADHTGQVEHPLDTIERRRQRLMLRHVAQHDLGAGAVQPARRFGTPGQGAHLPSARPQLAHQLGAEVAGGAGDQRAHGRGAYPGKATLRPWSASPPSRLGWPSGWCSPTRRSSSWRCPRSSTSSTSRSTTWPGC